MYNIQGSSERNIMFPTYDDKKDSHPSCIEHKGTPLSKMVHTYEKIEINYNNNIEINICFINIILFE